MASKKILDAPSELPNAKIYLDDLAEIQGILQDVYPNEVITYENEAEEEHETIADLEQRGGSSSKFRIRVGDRSSGLRLYSFLAPELSIYGLSNADKWATYSKINHIFKSRGYKFRNALQMLPAWFRWLLWMAWSAGLPQLFKHTSRAIYISEFAVWLVLTCLIGISQFSRSRVVFVRSSKVSAVGRDSWKTYLVNFLFAVLGAALSVLLQAAWDHLH